MAYEVFCRLNQYTGRRCKVVNELYSDRDKAIEKFIELSKTYSEVSLQKRRKNKFDDGWREKEKLTGKIS